MSLFNLGSFILHSGDSSQIKIDCDALTDSDWECLAFIIKKGCPRFSKVVGVPRGGDKLASALVRYIDTTANRTLIVDDVLTTGNSMQEMYDIIEGPKVGCVVFSRGKPEPMWIMPIFELNSEIII